MRRPTPFRQTSFGTFAKAVVSLFAFVSTIQVAHPSKHTGWIKRSFCQQAALACSELVSTERVSCPSSNLAPSNWSTHFYCDTGFTEISIAISI